MAPNSGLKVCEPAPNSKRIGLADSDSARHLNAIDHQGGRHVVFENRRAEGSADAFGFHQILMRNGEPVQQP